MGLYVVCWIGNYHHLGISVSPYIINWQYLTCLIYFSTIETVNNRYIVMYGQDWEIYDTWIVLYIYNNWVSNISQSCFNTTYVSNISRYIVGNCRRYKYWMCFYPLQVILLHCILLTLFHQPPYAWLIGQWVQMVVCYMHKI